MPDMLLGNLRIGFTTNAGAFKSDLESLSSPLQSLHSTLESIGQQSLRVGQDISLGLTVPLTTAAGAVIKLASDFQSSMAKVEGLTNTPASAIEGLKNQVLELTKVIPQSADELAKGLYFVSSAGYTGAEGMKILESAARAASSGMGTTEVMAKNIVFAMHAYAKEGLDAARITDILTQAVIEGSAEANQFAGSIGRVLPIASAMGLSLEEVTANMAVMTNIGLSTDEAATALRATLSAIEKPGKDASDALKIIGDRAGEAGLTFEVLRKRIKDEGLLSVLQDLIQKTGGNVAELSILFPNIRALVDVLGSAKQQGDEYAQTLDNIKNSQGAASHAFEVAQQTFAAQAKLFENALQAIGIAIGNQLMPKLIPLMQMVRDILPGAFAALASAWGALGAPIQTFITSFITIVAVMGPVVLGFGFLLTALSALITPVGLVVLAFAGITAALSAWVGSPLEALKTFVAMVQSLSDVHGLSTFDAALQALSLIIGETFGPAAEAKFDHFTQAIGDGFARINQLVNLAIDVFNIFRDHGLSPLTSALGALHFVIEDVFGPEAAGVFDQFSSLIQNTVSTVTDLIGKLTDIFKQDSSTWAGALLGWLVEAGSQLIDGLGNLLGVIGTWIGQALGWIREHIGPIADAFVMWVMDAAPILISNLVQLADRLINWIIAQGPTLRNNLTSWIASFASWVLDAIPPLLTELGRLMAAVFEWVVSKIPDIAAELGKWALAFIEWAYYVLPPLLTTLGDLLAGIVHWAAGAVPDLIQVFLSEWVPAFIGWVLGEALPKLLVLLAELAKRLGNWAINEGGPALIELGLKLAASIVVGISQGLGKIDQMFRDKIGEWKDNAVNALSNIGKEGGETPTPGASRTDAAVTALSNRAPSTLPGVAVDQGLASGMVQGIPEVEDAVDEVVASLDKRFQADLETGSPSERVARAFGLPIPQGLAKGIHHGKEIATTALQEMLYEMLTTSMNFADEFGKVGAAVMSKFTDAWTSNSPEAGRAFMHGLEKIYTDLRAVSVPQFGELATQIVEAGIAAIREHTPEAKAAFEEILAQGAQVLQDANSPSGIWGRHVRDLADVSQYTSDFGKGGVDAALAFTDAIGNPTAQTEDKLWNLVQAMIKTATEKGVPGIQELSGDLSEALTAYWKEEDPETKEAIAQRIVADLKGIGLGIDAAKPEVMSEFDKFQRAISETVIDPEFLANFGKAGAKAASTLTDWMTRGLRDGFETVKGEESKAGNELQTTIMDAINKGVPGAVAAGSSLMEQLKNIFLEKDPELRQQLYNQFLADLGQFNGAVKAFDANKAAQTFNANLEAAISGHKGELENLGQSLAASFLQGTDGQLTIDAPKLSQGINRMVTLAANSSMPDAMARAREIAGLWGQAEQDMTGENVAKARAATDAFTAELAAQKHVDDAAKAALTIANAVGKADFKTPLIANLNDMFISMRRVMDDGAEISATNFASDAAKIIQVGKEALSPAKAKELIDPFEAAVQLWISDPSDVNADAARDAAQKIIDASANTVGKGSLKVVNAIRDAQDKWRQTFMTGTEKIMDENYNAFVAGDQKAINELIKFGTDLTTQLTKSLGRTKAMAIGKEYWDGLNEAQRVGGEAGAQIMRDTLQRISDETGISLERLTRMVQGFVTNAKAIAGQVSSSLGGQQGSSSGGGGSSSSGSNWWQPAPPGATIPSGPGPSEGGNSINGLAAALAAQAAAMAASTAFWAQNGTHPSTGTSGPGPTQFTNSSTLLPGADATGYNAYNSIRSALYDIVTTGGNRTGAEISAAMQEALGPMLAALPTSLAATLSATFQPVVDNMALWGGPNVNPFTLASNPFSNPFVQVPTTSGRNQTDDMRNLQSIITNLESTVTAALPSLTDPLTQLPLILGPMLAQFAPAVQQAISGPLQAFIQQALNLSAAAGPPRNLTQDTINLQNILSGVEQTIATAWPTLTDPLSQLPGILTPILNGFSPSIQQALNGPLQSFINQFIAAAQNPAQALAQQEAVISQRIISDLQQGMSGTQLQADLASFINLLPQSLQGPLQTFIAQWQTDNAPFLSALTSWNSGNLSFQNTMIHLEQALKNGPAAFAAAVSQLPADMQSIVNGLSGWLQNVIPTLADPMQQLPAMLQAVLSGYPPAEAAILNAFLMQLAGTLTTGAGQIGAAIAGAIPSTSTFDQIMTLFANQIKDNQVVFNASLLGAIPEALRPLTDPISAILQGLPVAQRQSVLDAIQSVTNAFLQTGNMNSPQVTAMLNALTNMGLGELGNDLKALLPALLLLSTGNNIPQPAIDQITLTKHLDDYLRDVNTSGNSFTLSIGNVAKSLRDAAEPLGAIIAQMKNSGTPVDIEKLNAYITAAAQTTDFLPDLLAQLPTQLQSAALLMAQTLQAVITAGPSSTAPSPTQDPITKSMDKLSTYLDNVAQTLLPLDPALSALTNALKGPALDLGNAVAALGAGFNDAQLKAYLAAAVTSTDFAQALLIQLPANLQAAALAMAQALQASLTGTSSSSGGSNGPAGIPNPTITELLKFFNDVKDSTAWKLPKTITEFLATVPTQFKNILDPILDAIKGTGGASMLGLITAAMQEFGKTGNMSDPVLKQMLAQLPPSVAQALRDVFKLEKDQPSRGATADPVAVAINHNTATLGLLLANSVNYFRDSLRALTGGVRGGVSGIGSPGGYPEFGADFRSLLKFQQSQELIAQTNTITFSGMSASVVASEKYLSIIANNTTPSGDEGSITMNVNLGNSILTGGRDSIRQLAKLLQPELEALTRRRVALHGV